MLLQAKQLVLELSQPVAAICYRAGDRAGISRQGKAAAAAVLETLPDVLGEQRVLCHLCKTGIA
jgi:hypothetical protein